MGVMGSFGQRLRRAPVSRWARSQAEAYRRDAPDDRPLGGYLRALTGYGAGVGVLVTVARRHGRQAPERVSPWDVVLLGIATHKVSRTIAKDAVTSPLRAPFTRFEGPSGEGEVSEQVRSAAGSKHVAGELLTCPFCLAQWISTGFVAGWVLAPGPTRVAAATMAGVAVSDYLQLGYAALQNVAEG